MITEERQKLISDAVADFEIAREKALLSPMSLSDSPSFKKAERYLENLMRLVAIAPNDVLIVRGIAYRAGDYSGVNRYSVFETID
jgi:hypothetical protein